MSLQKHIFLIAFACSLGLHLASFGVYVEYAHLHETAGLMASLRTKKAPPATTPADELIVYPEMGDDQASGIGSNSSPGEQPMLAREADEDQALLSRNPQGSGRIDLPSRAQRGPIGNGKGGLPAQTPMPPAPPAAAPLNTQKPVARAAPQTPPNTVSRQPPIEVTSALPLPKAADGQIDPSPQPKKDDRLATQSPEATPPSTQPPKPAVQEETSTPQAKQMSSPDKPQVPDGDGKQRGVPPAAGNPLPQSESDSDPFSRISGNIVVPRVGRLEPRLGRTVHTTRPQVNIAGEIDLIALNGPTVVLEVHIAPTGKVTDVKIAHSSGSNAIDEPTRVAVYDWWFEPAKDKTGKPVPDVIFFTVKFI